MAVVIVERSFEAPVDLKALQALEDAVDWCLRQLRVTFLHGYVSSDLRHGVCFYEGPDAEAVRHTQRQGGLPFDGVWTATALLGPPRVPATDDDGRQTIIAQRQLPHAQDRADPERLVATLARSAERAGVDFVESFFAPGTGRMVCRFRAEDLGIVRAISAEAGVPMIRSWSAITVVPESGAVSVER